MAIVTNLEYALENRLIKKLDLMIDRCTQDNPKKDAVLINEGGEGEGKTNASVLEAYYIKSKTGREAHLYFRVAPIIEFAKNTDGKIIILDEPSLDSLSTDQLTKLNRDLLRLFMTVRKKRHFFIINLTKFWKFSEYLTVDRALGLVHLYSRREIEPGRFCYIKKSKLEELWNGYSKSKKRLYGKLGSFRGTFPDAMRKSFDKMDFFVNGIPNATLDIYEREKDKAIQSIGVDEKISKKELVYIKRLDELRYRVSQLPYKSKELLATHLGINSKRLREWGNLNQKLTIPLGNSGFETNTAADIITIRGQKNKNLNQLERKDEDRYLL